MGRRAAGRRGGHGSGARLRTMREVQADLEALLGKELDPAIFSGCSLVDDADSAAHFLRSLLRAGALGVGDEVPAEGLAGAIGLHRNTLSKALHVLADEGYLQRRPGRPARVVSTRAVLPARQSPMISHTRVAHDHHLEISSEVTMLERRALARVDGSLQPRVARHLELEPGEEVIVLSRIRRLREEGTLGPWVPAIAETAYFAAGRVPGSFFDDLEEPGRVESIHEYFTANNIRVVNSEYRIRISRLPVPLVAAWARAAAIGTAQAKGLRFLRLESTTHSHQGPLEYSMAFLAEGLFALSTTAFTVEIRGHDALRVGRRG